MSAEQLALVHAHLLVHQYQLALNVAREALRESSVPLLLSKALCEHRLGNSHQAIADLSQALALDPLSHHAYFNLFSIHHSQG
jgi:tetratricopeptide (TPR) repeat protein